MRRARAIRRRYGRASKRRLGPVGLRYAIEPSRFGHVVVAYTNSGTRMPLATYSTHAAAVAGVAANRRAMQGGT